jgi:hypothetical protein
VELAVVRDDVKEGVRGSDYGLWHRPPWRSVQAATPLGHAGAGALGQVEATTRNRHAARCQIVFLAFLIWAAWNGPSTGVKKWWVVFPAAFLVGACFAVPLYFFMRERTVRVN